MKHDQLIRGENYLYHFLLFLILHPFHQFFAKLHTSIERVLCFMVDCSIDVLELIIYGFLKLELFLVNLMLPLICVIDEGDHFTFFTIEYYLGSLDGNCLLLSGLF